MNLRVVTFLSYEGEEEEIKDLVADYCEILIKRGFANDPEDSSIPLKSLISVKENVEVVDITPEVFFSDQLQGSLLVVIPTDENKTVEGLVEAVEEYTGEDGA
jgi:hypothetical protein